MQQQTVRIIPVLGRKTDVPADDMSLLRPSGERVFRTHDVGGLNVSYNREKNCCTKANGYAAWSNTATTDTTLTQKLFFCEESDGTQWQFHMENGDLYYYDGSKDPQKLDDGAGGPSFSTNADVHADMLFYADQYLVVSDGAVTPYKYDVVSGGNLTKLIQSGTEYKFKYLTEWQRRFIGAYTDQTNGDLSVRYSSALPTMGSLEFASGDQLYKPTTDPITGMHKLGANSLFVFGSDSISRLKYYANATTPFGILSTVDGQGTPCQDCIVEAAGALWFFNRNYGFVRYTGSNRIGPTDIISQDIEDIIENIDSDYYDRIVGTYLYPETICWCIPYGQATPNYLLSYNLRTRNWEWEDKVARYLDSWVRSSGEMKKLVFGATDGHVYQRSGEANASGSLNGYRIEPIMTFGSSEKTLLSEVWFGVVDGGDYDLHLWHRGGDTIKEVEASGWTSMGTLNLNNPANPVIYLSQNERAHQIKWGTDSDSEKFAVNWIDFNVSVQGKY